MSNNPFDFPKSKIPVPEPPYLSASRAGFLSDLSDQVFFDENVPTPVDPLDLNFGGSGNLNKPPPYSYGPRGLLHNNSNSPSPSPYNPIHNRIEGPNSPHMRGARRRNITRELDVDAKLEELLGPATKLDLLEDNVDEILLQSIKQSRSLEDINARGGGGGGRGGHSRYSPNNQEGRYTESPTEEPYIPFRRLSDRMDRKKSNSNSQLHLESLGLSVGNDNVIVGPGSGARVQSFSNQNPSYPTSQNINVGTNRNATKGKPMNINKGKGGSRENLNVTSSNVPAASTSPKKSPSKGGGVVGAGATNSNIGGVKKESPSKGKKGENSKVKVPIVTTTAASASGSKKENEVIQKSDVSPSKGGKTALKKGENVIIGGSKEEIAKAVAAKVAGGSVHASPSKAGGGSKRGSAKKDGVPEGGGTPKHQPALAGTDVAGADMSKLDEDKKQDLLRDTAAAFKLLNYCNKGDWHSVESQLKHFEKSILSGVGETRPLAGIFEEETGWTPLMYAIKDNRIPLADRMVELGCDVNHRNKETQGAIHIAALYGRDETVRFLVFKKADVTSLTEPKKQNVLHLACSRSSGNSTAILRALLSVVPKDARLQRDADGNIPLFVALNAGSRGACQELLTSQAHEQMRMHTGPQKDTPLHLAVRKRDLEMARIFVDASANVDGKNGMWQTPLHIAAEAGDENLVKFFYLCKANPNISDKEDRTPIYLAAMNGHTQIIELLADKFKVSVFERTRDGSTLMHIASLHGHPETAMALFRKGVPLQMPNKGGARSLHIAARHGHAPMISKLLEKGEKVDAVTNENYTALHIAVESGRPNVVETLLGHGAQVHIKGGEAKETPLHIAARVDEGEKCAQMLLKSGADPNITMENGETPLHVAARHGRLRIIRLLLQDGANLQKTAKEGETPLHLACRYGHLRVVKELLQYIKRDKSEADMNLYINHITMKGESALHYAAKLRMDEPGTPGGAQPEQIKSTNGKEPLNAGKEIAKLLLDGGASVSKPTKDFQETPFHYCAREGNNDILNEMLSRMTQVECQRAVNKQSSKGWSPLLIACHKGHTDVVKTLLENHARVDVFDNEGRSALHLAAENGYQEICGILLKHKAFINAKSRVGFTALHLAATKGYTKLCLFLIQEHGASVDAVTLKKQTPLHLAAEAGQLEVCRLLMGLRASPDATDEKGQKPIHLGAENNHSDVIKLFLKHQNSLVTSATRDGSTCAHLAAMQGSVSVLEELMKFDKTGVISARNRSTDSTALQLAAEGGHAELVKSLMDAGANPSDENRAGYAAIHLAAKNGHTNVLDALKASDEAVKLTSRKLGLTALHIAAYYGQTEMVRELLPYISGKTPSEPPISVAASFIKELGTESGLTPLHMAAYSGEENVVRLLLNSQGVQVDAPTTNLGFNPLHLACRGGHTTVVSLLLSRSSELLESKDASGKSSLHIAAIHGHLHMVEVLLGQGAEIDAIDKELWTPLICASKAGHLEVVKSLVESGASPLAKTSKGHSPIWFAAAENHIPVLSYLMKKEHDTYGLMDDKEFVFNLTVCGKNNDNEPIDEFVLSSPAPVDVSAKLSNILINLSTKEKERAKDLIAASKHCESMAAELLALAAGAESAGKILESADRKGVEFLDVLIENEQKEVIAHSVVQRYLQELWVGNLTWANWKLLLLFFSFIVCPPVWIIFSLPLGHRYYKIPIIKFMSYLTSHIHLMILLCLTSVTPIYPVLPIRTNLFPFWFEWILLAWLAGLIISEVTNPSDKAGLGWIKVAVLVFSIMGILLHCIGFFISKSWYGTLLYLRNQLLGMAVLLACVQILDFLSFHYLFGPWAIIIGNLMKDLARFLAVLMIFMVGFSLVMAALNSPIHPRRIPTADDKPPKTLTNGLPSGVRVTPIDAFELLFFALFGLNGAAELKIETLGQPDWTLILFKIFFGVYMLVTVVVLINLLIAMMSDTYQRIQAQSDIEWKYGLAKLIRNMHRTSATPSPINLFTSWIMWIYRKCKKASGKGSREPFNPFKRGKGLDGSRGGGASNLFPFGKPTPKQRWKAVFKKTQMTPRVSDIMRLSVAQVSPMGPGSPLQAFGSTLSVGNQQRIETVTDWPLIAKKYRILVGKEEPHMISEENPLPTGSTPNVQQA